MPSDDLVLNVRQIAQYTPTENAPTNASLLMQLGIGGPYLSISPQDLVATALATGGDMAIAGPLAVQSVSGGSLQFSNAAITMLSSQKACIVDFAATFGTLGGVPIATQTFVEQLVTNLQNTVVWAFNGRRGDVRLWIDDIICAGGAPLYSPRFEGEPRAWTPPPTSNSSRVATTAFVATAIGGITDVFAPLDSPAFTGLPTAPTPAQGSADGQLATTAFVANAVAESTSGVASFNGRTGIVALAGGDITAAGGALLASPVFTGAPSAPTQPTTDNSARLATTAFVQAFAAPLASPAFTGIPTAPTAAPSTSTTQLATTAFVTAAIAAGMTGVVTTFNGRTGAVNLIANDVSAAGGALLASPALTGTPTAPTASPSTSNTQLATCAFVMAAVATSGGVLTFNGRAGAVTLTAADVSAVGGALLASPAFTGTPTASTAAPGTGTTQLATCAFVMAAVSAATAGVASFNGRTGAVSLIATDVTAVLPASTVTPAMDGVAAVGTLAAWARGDHVHPTDTSRYAATNPSNFQTAAQVTASLAAYLPLSGGTLTGNLNTQGVAAASITASGNLVVSGTTTLDGNTYFSHSAVTDFVAGAVAPNRQIQFTVGSVVNVNSSTGTFSWTWSNTNMFTCGPDATFTVGTLVQTSDGDGKADIVDYVGGLADLLQLRPRSFKRLSPVTRAPVASELGFVHQEARPVREEFGPISTEKGISPTAILACAVAAIQDLSAKLDALMGRVDQLEVVR
jgi:hypothetical protein